MSFKILFVDDETDLFPVIKSNFRKEIKQDTYEFIFASNGQEGLEKLATLSGKVDLIITDLKMPELDGNAFLSRLNEEAVSIKTIIISAYEDLLDFSRRIAQENVVDFLFKPLNYKTEFKALVKRALFSNDAENHEVKYQKVSKLFNQLSSNNKLKLITKGVSKLEYEALQEVIVTCQNYLESAQIRKEEREMLKEKQRRGEIDFKGSFDLMEGNYIEARMVNENGPYYYLRYKQDGKLHCKYLGTEDPRQTVNKSSQKVKKINPKSR